MENRKIWSTAEFDPLFIEELKKKFSLKTPIAKVIATRGFTSESDIDDFLNPALSKLPAPSMLKDLKKGALRVAKAINNKERIAIYGDYDADGVTACALMYLFLKNIDADVIYFIPDRFEDGYSLNKKAIDDLKSKGVNIIITVDCGISDCDLVEYGNSLGLEFIITDHHNVSEKIPNAYAVINPKRKDNNFPYKELSGVGVAFYFLIKLRKILRENGYFSHIKEPNLKEYLDLVAIGTISDMVPLLGPNRIFVKHGLEEIKKSKRVGIKALLKELSIDNTLDPRSVAFKITPRLNAPGRMSNPKHALELLIADNEDKAAKLVQTLNRENARRQKEEEKVIQDALKMLEKVQDKLVYVLYAAHWHPGVLGIVASKLMERYGRPFFIFTEESEGFVKGSGRSMDGFPLTEVIGKLGSLDIDFGGHDFACGLTLKKEMVKKFDEQINTVAKDYLCGEKYGKECQVDAVLSLSDIDDRFFSELKLLEPFGKGNPEPTFVIPQVLVESSRFVGVKENHLKLSLKKENVSFSCIGFYMFVETLKEKTSIDIVGIPRMSYFNGNKSWDFILKDYYVIG